MAWGAGYLNCGYHTRQRKSLAISKQGRRRYLQRAASGCAWLFPCQSKNWGLMSKKLLAASRARPFMGRRDHTTAKRNEFTLPLFGRSPPQPVNHNFHVFVGLAQW